ncbi:ATP-binding protein [Clostridium sp. AM58-1XD]|uniref:ATP-binding protein n=1 Tax=Clostridium sp. AM58-1XD TaxID=2292307 RepID=UPI0026D2E380
MKRESTAGIKKKIALAAVVVIAALGFLTFSFIQEVKEQLWEQSVSTIMESTRQGCNTLRVQLIDDYNSLRATAEHLNELSGKDREQRARVEEMLSEYSQTESGTSLYLKDGTCIPAGTQMDMEAQKALFESGLPEGVVNPHISSVTGVNVFDIFIEIKMADGTEGYLIKEYEVDEIADSFSLSFYNNSGFSYVVNAKGEILIRSPHPNSNKTIKNIFDMLPESQNSSDGLTEFRRSLENSRTGWAVFTYQNEKTVFCYIPLKLGSDWHLISIIPQKVVNAQTNAILLRSLALIVSIIFGISALAAFYMRYANRTNRRLKNQADYIGHLYNAIPEGVALITAETPNCFLQLNQEGLRLLGYPEGAKNNAPKGTELQKTVHPEDYRKMEELFRKASEDGQKHGFETRMVRLEGGWFWANGMIEKTLDENGIPVLIAAFHDITVEKLAGEAAEREKLQERITLVGAISNAYPVIISINLTKDTLNFIYVKQNLMIGLGEEKQYSRLFGNILYTIHPGSRDEFQEKFALDNLREALGPEKNEVYIETEQKLMDGKYHWTSIQIINVDNPYSEDKLAILISRRIDEQRYEHEQHRQALQSALDSARAASVAKSQFLSNMSHDIRTPMNAIVGMTAIAASHLDDRDRVMECLTKIELSSSHLLGLINDVLDMSKIESGKLSIKNEPFNFAELVSDTVDLILPEANAKRLKTEVRLSALKNENVVGDSLRLRQVCINILSNAVKYTPEGGTVRVEARQMEGFRRGFQNYVFLCADNGIGMSSEFLKKIFQPFERAQDSTSSKVAGTGLGMAITKNLVDLMNGDITVESTPGQGSVFTVTILCSSRRNARKNCLRSGQGCAAWWQTTMNRYAATPLRFWES